eukprot:1878030-Pleurochrysis_carterae.AAC.1
MLKRVARRAVGKGSPASSNTTSPTKESLVKLRSQAAELELELRAFKRMSMEAQVKAEVLTAKLEVEWEVLC